MKRGVCVLGSTGTIGTYTLELVEKHPDRFEVKSLAAGKNVEKLREQIRQFRPKQVSVLCESDAEQLAKEFPDVAWGYGAAGVEACIDVDGVEAVIVGIVGFAGLAPTLHAIRKNRLVGVANKESLVTAGTLLNECLAKSKATIVPVDSEHHALFQLLAGIPKAEVESVVLTASGGPLLRRPELCLTKVSPEIAVNHPKWKMGPKISVDSATLMNKGLEVIEAHFLFGFPEEKIEVWVHPQSIVHGAVHLVDGSCLAQLTVPDMKSAIGSALSYPGRLPESVRKLNFKDLARLEFEEPDNKRFPCLSLARHALKQGQRHTIALNAANEIAVEAFLAGRLCFSQIPVVIERTLAAFPSGVILDLPAVFSADEEARALALTFVC